MVWQCTVVHRVQPTQPSGATKQQKEAKNKTQILTKLGGWCFAFQTVTVKQLSKIDMTNLKIAKRKYFRFSEPCDFD